MVDCYPRFIVGTVRTTTIGVVTGWVDSAYHLRVLRAIRRTANEAGLNVATFVTAVPDDSGHYWHTLECLDPATLDGLILISSGLSHLTRADREAFLRQVAGIPTCGVAMEPPGGSSVSIDNESGLLETVRHLVRHHGHRRLAFVGGPEEDDDARARLRAFQQAVDAEGIDVDPRCVLSGDFMMTGGYRAVKTLLEDRGIGKDDLDAIVAANDGTARGCVDALAERGIRVPWHLAVVGFDDGIVAQQSPVPLTTVHQPLHRLGTRAVHQLLSRISGADAESAVLPTELVIRRSCGCLEGMGRLQLSAEDFRRRGGQRFGLALLERRDRILKEIQRATRERVGGLGGGWEPRLLTAFIDELTGRSSDAFRLDLQDLLDHLVEARINPAVFDDVVSVLWRHVVPCAMSDPGQRTTVEGLLDSARLAVSASAQRIRAGEIEANERLAESVGGACVELASSTRLQDVATIVQQRLPALGVRRLVLALYPRGGPVGGVDEVVRFDGHSVSLSENRVPLATLPSSVLVGGSAAEVLVMPLHARGAAFGVLCMEVRPVRAIVCMAIRDALSAALRRVRPIGRA